MTRLLIILSLTISLKTFSQNLDRQVVSSGSGTVNNQLTYTIGEPLILQTTGLTIGFNNFNISPVTGLQKETDQLQLYPNPTTGKFYIKDGQLIEPNKIRISNCLGQQVLPSISKENEIVIIDLDTFPSGAYLLRVDNRVHKIIKY